MIHLPLCSHCNFPLRLSPPKGLHPSLSKFTRDVVGPFALSSAQWGQACQVEVSHDRALPRPVSVMADDDGEE